LYLADIFLAACFIRSLSTLCKALTIFWPPSIPISSRRNALLAAPVLATQIVSHAAIITFRFPQKIVFGTLDQS